MQLQNAEPEKQAGAMADVLRVLGRPELDKQTLSQWRLDAQNACRYNRLQEQISDLAHRVTHDTPTNAVCCVSVSAATDNDKTLVPQPLLKRSDVRLLEKKLDMDVARQAYRKAQQRHPELPDLKGSNERLLYWAVTTTPAVLKTRTDPHLASSGDVLPMTHVVLLCAENKTARCIAHEGAPAFSQALGPLLVFKTRCRAKSKDNNAQLYMDTFAARVRGLRLALGEPDVVALQVVPEQDERQDDGADDDGDYDDAKERRIEKKKRAKSSKKKAARDTPKKAKPPKDLKKKRGSDMPIAILSTTSEADGNMATVSTTTKTKKAKLSVAPQRTAMTNETAMPDCVSFPSLLGDDDDAVAPGQQVEQMDVTANQAPVPSTSMQAPTSMVAVNTEPRPEIAAKLSMMMQTPLQLPSMDFNDFFANYQSRF